MAGGAGSNTGTPAASNPLGPQQGQGTPAFGGQQQSSMPSFATPQQQPSGSGFGVFGGGFGGGQQQPEMMMSNMQYRPEPQYQPQGLPRFGNQFGQAINQLTQNPFQPQQPSFMQDPEYQGYQTQANDLQRQMNEYMQKAPMYQQLQDLQGKMAPFQQRYQQQQMQQMQQMQRPSPFRRGQFQQPAGIQGLMGMLSGRGSGRDIGPYEQYVDRNNRALASASQEVKQPTMSRADFDAREKQIQRQSPMSMDMPQRNSFYKNGGKV